MFATGCSKDESSTTPTAVERILTLQPDADDGMDATIWSSNPTANMGSYQDFQAMGWTWFSFGLPPGIRRSLINFNLDSIPAGATITNAKLYLYYNEDSPEIPFY